MSDQQVSHFGNIMISYSRRNLAFVRKLYDGFIVAGMNDNQIWADWEDIPLSADWMVEITKGIREADAFIFVQSPDSLSSPVCGEEVDLAEINHKRIVVVQYIDPTPENVVRPVLLNADTVVIQAVEDIPVKISEVIAAVNKDLTYVQPHTRLQVRATDWQENNAHQDLLLRGEDISDGESWLAGATDKEPRPTGLQGEYLIASREYQTVRDRRRMFWLVGFMLMAIVALVVASFQFVDAKAAEKLADDNRQVAETQSHNADLQAATAVSAGETAVVESNIAGTKEALAEAGATQQAVALFQAETHESIALTEEDNAHIESTAAEIARETSIAALETSVAEANARATQQAIAEAEAIARATQQAIAIQKAAEAAAQEATAQAEATQHTSSKATANANATLAVQAKATADAERRLANALAMASTALQIQYTDPQLARLLVLLAVKETDGLLAQPSDAVKGALVEIASNPLLKDLEIKDPSTNNGFVEVEITAGEKLLTHSEGGSNIYVRDLATGVVEATYSIGFAAYEFGLDPDRNMMVAYNDTKFSFWPDVTSPSHTVLTPGVGFSKIVDFSIYPSTDQLVILSANSIDSQVIALYDISGATPTLQNSVSYDDPTDTILDADTWSKILLAPRSGSTIPGAFTIGYDSYSGSYGWYFSQSGSLLQPPTRELLVRHSLHTTVAVLTPDYKNLVLATGVLIKFYEYPSSSSAPKIYSGHEGEIYNIAFSKSPATFTSRTLVISVEEAGVAKIYEYDNTGTASLTEKGQHNNTGLALTDVIIFPDEKFYVTGSNESEVMWFDLEESAPVDYLAAITELEGELLNATLDSQNCAKYTPTNCTYSSLYSSPVAQTQPSQMRSALASFSLFFGVVVAGVVFFQQVPVLKRRK